MVRLSNEEKVLLEEVQKDFPLSRRPFGDIGKRAGLTEGKTITLLRTLKEEQIIREVSILLNAGKIGYKSTLVALQAGDGEMKKVIPRINAHGGVSHNYVRDASFNIWFTLTIPQHRDFEEEVTGLLTNQSLPYLILPALHIFKIGVKFPMTGERAGKALTDVRKNDEGSVPLTSFEKELLRTLQRDFPLEPEPWDILATQCGIDPGDLLGYISRWSSSGVIKRISAFLRHRNLGFTANGMACYRISPGDIPRAGCVASQFHEVSHCYQRPAFDRWPYSLYTMVHCKEKKECDSIIDTIARQIQCDEYRVLYSSKELKKERIKYFMEEK